MKINKKIIETLNLRKDKFDKFIKHYGDKTFTKQQFMDLKNITHEDKVCIAFKLIPKENIKFVTENIAETVLQFYETEFPNDDRLRKAIEEARNGNCYAADIAGTIDDPYGAYASYFAAYASYASYYTPHIARDAAYATAFAAGRVTIGSHSIHQKLIRKIVMRYMK